MNLLPRRSMLAIAAVVDIAFHARPAPIAAKALAARHGLPPRHLETLLQVLVRAGILKGVRGPRGGYELARERRKITVADIIRAASATPVATNGHGNGHANGTSASMDGGEDVNLPPLVNDVIVPAIDAASELFLERLDDITVEDLCGEAQNRKVFDASVPSYDFTI